MINPAFDMGGAMGMRPSIPASDAALNAFKTAAGWQGLPWEVSELELTAIFRAGFDAGVRHATPSYVPISCEPSPALTSEMLMKAYEDMKTARVRDDLALTPEVLPPIVLTPDAPVLVKCEPRAITPEEIYKAYPRHVGKAAALKAIKKALATSPAEPMVNGLGDPLTRREYLLMAVKAYKSATDTWPAAERQYIPHPATWFNGGRYDYDRKEWRRGPAAASSQFSKPSR